MSRMQHQQNCWCHPAEDCDPPVEGDAPCSHVNPECEALQIAHERLVAELKHANGIICHHICGPETELHVGACQSQREFLASMESK